MPSPDPVPGVVEQAIYTWSTVNLGGGKGVGFGAVSAGLRADYRWLDEWPTRRFEPFAFTKREAFDGWRDAVTHGSFTLDGWNVVYRKIPAAGQDQAGRDRFLVHALVGRREDLDLSRVASDSRFWLDAEDCPLDKLPRLDSLRSDDLEQRPLEHDDSRDDPRAADLLDRLQRGRGLAAVSGLFASDIDDFVRAAHIAIPTALWPDLGITCSIGPDGLQLEVAVDVQRALSSHPHAAHPRLRTCALHSRVDARWQRAASWEHFASTARGEVVASEPGQTIRSSSPAPALGDALKPREALRREIASLVGDAEWNFDRPIDGNVLVSLTSGPPVDLAAWIAQAPRTELRVLLGAARRPNLINALAEQIHHSNISTATLVSAWQRSAAAPLGIAALRRPDADRMGNWAIPDGRAEDHVDDAAAIAGALVGSPTRCVSFFTMGIIGNRSWRRLMIESLLRAGARLKFVFDELLAGAGADERVYCEVALDHLDGFAEWLGLPDSYRTAFRVGLTRPSWISRLLDRTRH